MENWLERLCISAQKEVNNLNSKKLFCNVPVGSRSYSSVLHWKRSAPSTTEKWEGSFPFQTIFAELVKTTASTRSWSIKIPQDSQQCTRKLKISSNALWKYRISLRTGWYWGRWIWRNWSRLICKLSQTGRETSEHWRLKGGKLKNYLCKSDFFQLMIAHLLRTCKNCFVGLLGSLLQK